MPYILYSTILRDGECSLIKTSSFMFFFFWFKMPIILHISLRTSIKHLVCKIRCGRNSFVKGSRFPFTTQNQWQINSNNQDLNMTLIPGFRKTSQKIAPQYCKQKKLLLHWEYGIPCEIPNTQNSQELLRNSSIYRNFLHLSDTSLSTGKRVNQCV